MTCLFNVDYFPITACRPKCFQNHFANTVFIIYQRDDAEKLYKPLYGYSLSLDVGDEAVTEVFLHELPS